MHYLFACCTDAGKRKGPNQDSLLFKEASCKGERVALAAVCDGMGGLWKGELASASMVRAFSGWFERSLPGILSLPSMENALLRSWDRLLADMNERLEACGSRKRSPMGTTATAMLFARGGYYIAHVGDCRAYEIGGQIRQLTKDQTLVQREVENGRLTREEAERDARRNVLLQCVGASGELCPAYERGTVREDAVYVLCCDGFRHHVREPEMLETLAPRVMNGEKAMKRQLAALVALNQKRGEQDNISVLAVRPAVRKGYAGNRDGD
ncbi:MAG: serine/threonine-protein phosphatase [Lachnospiraceae bacterium]